MLRLNPNTMVSVAKTIELRDVGKGTFAIVRNILASKEPV